MDKRLNVIKQYYTSLDYIKLRPCKQIAVEYLSDISRQLKCEGDDFDFRTSYTIDVITRNYLVFPYVCDHVDIIKAIIYKLSIYSKAFMPKYSDLPLDKYKENIWTIMLSLLNDCRQQEMQLFLETCIIKKSSLDNRLYKEYKNLLPRQTVEIIILEDADLFAIISYLKIPGNTRYFNKIWVSEQIRRNFLSFMHKHFNNDLFTRFLIRVFESKQELLTPPTPYKINIASIWSEDIVAAENLAASLDRNIVLINTLDFGRSMVLMPYVEIFKSQKEFLDSDEDQYIISTIKPINPKNAKPILPPKRKYDVFFYDGTWQNSIKGIYWRDGDTLKPHATSEDIAKCVLSARKGFKIWSTWSTESRMQVLSKYSSLLKQNGELELSKLIRKWLQFPHWYQFYTDNLLPNVQDNTAVLKRIHVPKGIVTLMEKEKTDLFRKLTQSLVIGNSVIVICTAKSCNMTSHDEIFSKSGMPPGVVNLLFCENIHPLSECYAASDLGKMYTQYTKMKQILVFNSKAM